MADAAVVWIEDLEKVLGLSSTGQDNQANNVSGIPGSGAYNIQQWRCISLKRNLITCMFICWNGKPVDIACWWKSKS